MSVRRRRVGATAITIFALAVSASSALERRDLELTGPWLQLGAGGGSGWVLAATGSQARRTLVELHWPAGTFTTRSTEVPADVAQVLPQAGGGAPLLGGGDVALAVGEGGATTVLATGGDELLAREEGGVALPPPFLALAEVGALQPVALAGTSLQPRGDAQRFPALAERKSWGLEVSAPPRVGQVSTLRVAPSHRASKNSRRRSAPDAKENGHERGFTACIN